MTLHRPALCLALLLTALAAADPRGASATDLTAGEVRLKLSSRAVSSLPIDLEALAEFVCGNPLPQGGGAMGHCRLTIGVPPKSPLMIVSIVDPAATPLDQALRWQMAGLRLSGTALESSCGTWESWLSLDESVPQPISMIHLESSPGGEDQGDFVAYLLIRVVLHLTHQATAQTQDFPLRLRVGLLGQWLLKQPEEWTLSNLHLFAGSKEDPCFPMWIEEAPTGLFIEEVCQICFDAGSGAGN